MNANEPWTLPASYAQERIWFASQLAGDLPVYRVVSMVRAPYPLAEEAIAAGLATVVDRHESMRTCLLFRDGALLQAIHASVPIELERVDVPEADYEARTEELHRKLLAVPLALDRAPLWRAVAVRMGTRGWTVLFVAHHAIFDGTSEVNLRAELTEAYAAAAQSRPAQLPELRIQYPDYTMWHRDRLAAGRLDELQEYWRKALAGIPPVHRLPTDRPRPANRTFRGASVEFPVAPRLSEDVAALARARGATVFMVLLAAYAAVLHRMSGEDDIVVGVPVAGRDLPELQALIGMFVNMVVLRVDASGDPAFDELLLRVRTTTLSAWDHQDMPYQKLVEALAARRDPGVPPLYQLGFNYVPGGFDDDTGTAEDDMMLEVATTSGRLQFNTALFDPASATAITSNYQRVLAAVLADPGLKLSALPVDTVARVAAPEAAATAKAYVPPRTAAEQLVADVWREVLEVPQAGAFDDFFELGGHSLLALRVIARLDAITGTDLPIQEFFADTSLAGVAATLERQLTREISEMSEEEAAVLLTEGEPPAARLSGGGEPA
jgi:hypothetical protein